MNDPEKIDSDLEDRLGGLCSSWAGPSPRAGQARYNAPPVHRPLGGRARLFAVGGLAFAMTTGFGAVAMAHDGFTVPFAHLHVGGAAGFFSITPEGPETDAANDAMSKQARQAREARQARQCPPQANGCASPKPGLRLGQDGGDPGRDTTGPAPGSNGQGSGSNAGDNGGSPNGAPSPKPDVISPTGKPAPRR